MQSRRDTFLCASLLATLCSLAACADAPNAPFAVDAAGASVANAPALERHNEESRIRPGAVYTLTNAADGNGVVAFHRAESGALTPLGTFATGGNGVGGTLDPLTSQYAVVLSESHDALFAVDAGSDDITSFRVGAQGALTLASRVSSGGTRPNSIAVHGGLVYALNSGNNTVSGFRVGGGAQLVAIPHSTRSLAQGADGAAAIRFTPDGKRVIVAERVSNRLEVFAVRDDGRLSDPVVTPGNGGASFGFDITSRSQPIVSETQGTLTSYALAANRTLSPITASISTGGNAPCWVTITADGRFAYTTNSASGTLAGYAVDVAGHLTPITPSGPTGDSGAGAVPLDFDHVGSRFLYTLEAGTGTIGTFAINADGTLAARPDVPAGAPSSGMQGLAAF
jgi:6-phosphogluconolactonase (cycloisomerase 2 family)